MSVEIRIPRLGWSMEEGTLVEWLKRDGDRINKGDALFVLESDKAAQEIESFDQGVLRIPPDGPSPGDTVKVGQLIAYLVAEGEAAPIGGVSSTVKTASERAVTLSRAPASGAAEVTSSDPATIGSSPRARRLARELGVDWTALTGTGRGGRVRERDVRAAAPSSARGAQPFEIPMSSIRRTIAARMVASLRTTAPVTLTTRANATNLVNWRDQLRMTAQPCGDPVPSVTDMVVKLVAQALESHPLLNARREGDKIVALSDIHIGVAVDTDQGLVVPVIRNVADLGVQQVAALSRALIEKARARRLLPEDLQGGTFTVTNLGMFGIDAFTPIINAPETAILGVGAIRREAVVLDDDCIVAQDVLTLSLTFDHQVIDGAQAARFLQSLVESIERGAAWLAG